MTYIKGGILSAKQLNELSTFNGGGGLFVVPITVSRNPNNANQWSVSSEITGDEIIEAIEAGKTIYLQDGTSLIQMNNINYEKNVAFYCSFGTAVSFGYLQSEPTTQTLNGTNV